MSTGSLFNANGERFSARIAGLGSKKVKSYAETKRRPKSGAVKKPASKDAAGKKAAGKRAMNKKAAAQAPAKKAAVKKPAAKKAAVAKPQAEKPQGAKKVAAKKPLITKAAGRRVQSGSNSPARARTPIRKPRFKKPAARKTKPSSISSSGSSIASVATLSEKPNAKGPAKERRAEEEAIEILSDSESEIKREKSEVEVKRESSQSRPHIKSKSPEDEPPLNETPQYLEGPNEQQHLRLWIDGARLIIQDIRNEPEGGPNGAEIIALLNGFQDQLDGDADYYDDNQLAVARGEENEEWVPLGYDRLAGGGTSQAALEEALAVRERETDAAYASERGLDLMYQVLKREMRRQGRLDDLDGGEYVSDQEGEDWIAIFKNEFRIKYPEP